MYWHSLTLDVDATQVELVSEKCFELGALSIDIRDAAADTADEKPLFGEPNIAHDEIWDHTFVSALFDHDADIATILQALKQTLNLSSQPKYALSQVHEQDWVKLTQSQFDPIKISQRLWIVPTWHTPVDQNAINLILDPGRAFGTGSHQTTQLCLSWLDEQLQPGDAVLDYGCGSGILAIAALKLGASRVIGIDIDANAIQASQENAKINHCDSQSIFFSTSLNLPVANFFEKRHVDKVVANILANPLILLAPLLANTLRKGGQIALSGILIEQAAQVNQCYQQWFDMHIIDQKDDWVLLAGVKHHD
ncbi:MAG: 50S ribosomal protein L11 methyltransferase [Nitrosomonas sp.]|nr:50S ribosomal protein L11 methyltransferase [Nitrosomonas sp.]